VRLSAPPTSDHSDDAGAPHRQRFPLIVIASPHNSGQGGDAHDIALRRAVENCRRALTGETPLHVIGLVELRLNVQFRRRGDMNTGPHPGIPPQGIVRYGAPQTGLRHTSNRSRGGPCAGKAAPEWCCGRAPACQRVGRAGAEPASPLPAETAPAASARATRAGTGHASLDELLVKIKSELHKLGPIIDLDVAREPQGSRTEGGSTVIEHGWRSGA
jgi:hypothetical protein